MDIDKAIYLGIVQGLTEFLPISSSGHLVIFQKIFGILKHDVFFDVVLHSGTLLAVILLYRKAIFEIIQSCVDINKIKTKHHNVDIAKKIFLTTLITGFIGIAFKDYFLLFFNNTKIVSIFFLITSILLFLTKFRAKEKFLIQDMLKIDYQITWIQALIIGFAQSLAIAPGISRSGTTIAVALFLGLNKKAASSFSFLICIPVILGALLLDIKDMEMDKLNVLNMVIGFVFSFFVGILALILLLKIINQGKLHIFSYYLWFIAIITFLL